MGSFVRTIKQESRVFKIKTTIYQQNISANINIDWTKTI